MLVWGLYKQYSEVFINCMFIKKSKLEIILNSKVRKLY